MFGEPTTEADTVTGVATVPALTMAWTLPCASLVAVGEVSVMPPTVVLSENCTFAPATGPADESSTRNTTVLVSGRLESPVPRSAMLFGVAEMYTMEPIVAAATFTVPDAERFWLPTVAVAVITSLPAQPRAT
jgi:hypothetical protein